VLLAEMVRRKEIWVRLAEAAYQPLAGWGLFFAKTKEAPEGRPEV
jgi:hypothetical protein